MPAPPGNLRQIPIYSNCSACKTVFSVALEIFEGAHRSANCIRLSVYCIFMIIQATSRSHSKLWKCKCSQHWTRRSPAQKMREAVRRTTVQVTRLLLQPELLKIGHDLLFSAWTDRGLVCIVYTYIYIYGILYTYEFVYILVTIDRQRLWQMTDPTPRQRGCQTLTKPKLSNST
jgi:hypothetical protein